MKNFNKVILSFLFLNVLLSLFCLVFADFSEFDDYGNYDDSVDYERHQKDNPRNTSSNNQPNSDIYDLLNKIDSNVVEGIWVNSIHPRPSINKTQDTKQHKDDANMVTFEDNKADQEEKEHQVETSVTTPVNVLHETTQPVITNNETSPDNIHLHKNAFDYNQTINFVPINATSNTTIKPLPPYSYYENIQSDQSSEIFQSSLIDIGKNQTHVSKNKTDEKFQADQPTRVPVDKFMTPTKNISTKAQPTTSHVYPEPQLITKEEWVCDFHTNQSNCGIENDFNMVNKFMLTKPGFDLAKTYLLFNISNLSSSSDGSRLVTPYFESQGFITGCLTIMYTNFGNEIEKGVITQQDQDNHCIWSDFFSYTRIAKPGAITLNIDLRRGPPRFFIEFYFKSDGPRNSVLALSKIDFQFNQCRIPDNVNYCRPEL